MPVTDDQNDPCLNEIDPVTGMQECYLVLSDEERARGFVRPYRDAYRHVGVRPTNPTRDLTDEEHERYDKFGYVKFEAYPEVDSSATGRFWSTATLNSGCGSVTVMGRAIAETYAREPGFYGGTYCSTCNAHFPVGAHGEFVWYEFDGTDGPRVGT